MNTSVFIDRFSDSFQKKYPDETLEDLVVSHKTSLKHLSSQFNQSLIDPNFEFGKIYYSEILLYLFSHSSYPSKQLKNSFFLGLYYFASTQKDSLETLDSPQANTLKNLTKDFEDLWKTELIFSLSKIRTYLRIWDNLKAWINNFDIRTPNLEFSKQNLLYLYFILMLSKEFMPNPLSETEFNSLSILSLKKAKEAMLRKIRRDSEELINKIIEKLAVLEAELASTIRPQTELTQLLPSDSENLDQEEEFFDAIAADEEQEFFDAQDTEEEFHDSTSFTAHDLDNLERNLNSLLRNLTPTHYDIRTSNSQSLTISNEEQLFEWINSKNPEILQSAQCMMEHISTLQENNRDVSAYKEQFTSLISQLFEELSRNTYTSFKLPRELQSIQRNISHNCNFPTNESSQEILGQVGAFLGKIDSCSFFSLTWLSHVWLYITSSNYRRTYKDLRKTINNNEITDQQKVEQLKIQFGVTTFQNFKELFFQSERNPDEEASVERVGGPRGSN